MAEVMLSDLNSKVSRDVLGVIERSEIKYKNRVENVADYVLKSGTVRIILLAGPSGSGKTTTANLISDRLKKLGEESIVVSLDDFYKNHEDKDYPRNSEGERDFECPESLKISEIAETLRNIADGKDFSLPKYDFKTGRCVEKKTYKKMPNGCVIVEGLHALNPKIADVLPHEKVLKLFVSVSTNINEEGERIISGRKIRFIRRLVRDSLYRGVNAEETLDMWRHVLSAEDIYLYPFKRTADMAFDTFHSFELGVMKPYVEKLISATLAEKDMYANTVLRAVHKVLPIDEKLIPETSLIKEFIPGGIYENLY